ncbi:MAG: hypothetical protein WC385_01655 [Candidatus Paceibacterota bacterium]|jgi:nicotinamidase-related amidase
MKYEFIAVDIQNEFATEGGKFYTPKPSIRFLKETLFPYLMQNNIKVNEIVSDYRQPRPGDGGDGCYPGTWGYESLAPRDLIKSEWVKCMNSPIWIRENGGEKDKKPGLPYPDPAKFGGWIEKNIGKPEDTTPVIFGLTIDCCVMSTVQEFRWRGFEPIVIREAVDHASGKIEDRDIVLEKTALHWWAKVISWKEFLNC